MSLSVAISLLALVVSGYTFWRTQRHNRQMLSTKVFLQLREDYMAVAGNIPHDHRNPLWLPQTVADAHHFEAYWNQCMSEWYVSNRLYADALRADLWEEFFKNSILRAMAHTSFRAVFCALRDCPKERYGRHEQAFFAEMAESYKKANGEDVTADIAQEDIDELKCLLGCKSRA